MCKPDKHESIRENVEVLHVHGTVMLAILNDIDKLLSARKPAKPAQGALELAAHILNENIPMSATADYTAADMYPRLRDAIAAALSEAQPAAPSATWTSRLAHIEQRTAIERQASDLKAAIESLGGHPLLTDALNAADRAMCILGKWHDDGEPGSNSEPASATPEPAALPEIRLETTAEERWGAGGFVTRASIDASAVRKLLDDINILLLDRASVRQRAMEEVAGIYIASKTVHADRWRLLRDKVGEPIISSWIDEAGEGATSDWSDLWDRCTREAACAAITIVYHEPGEVLKGGLVEVGAALSHNRKILVIGEPAGSWIRHRNVERCASMKEAIAKSREFLRARSTQRSE